ncbi:hypothetical protein BJH93_00120 [Kocuria polaris]|nr:hypothetical protein [Kocuria polaris]
MRRSFTLLAVGILGLTGALTGCSQVKGAAEEAASSAAGQVADTAKAEAIKRACEPVRDGTLDASDITLLSTMIEPAEAAGVPSSLLDQLRELAESGDSAPQAAVDRAQEVCDEAIAGTN